MSAGDIFHKLRAQIRAKKPETVSLFQTAGLEVMAGHPELPWVSVPDSQGKTSQRLDQLGIRGLKFTPSPALRDPYPQRLLLFSPLSDERMAQLRQRLEPAFEPASFAMESSQ